MRMSLSKLSRRMDQNIKVVNVDSVDFKKFH